MYCVKTRRPQAAACMYGAIMEPNVTKPNHMVPEIIGSFWLEQKHTVYRTKYSENEQNASKSLIIINSSYIIHIAYTVYHIFHPLSKSTVLISSNTVQ